MMKKNQGRQPKFRLSGQKTKKWREKDKKTLFEKVKERYLQYRKMKVNIVRLDPAKKRKNGSTS
jgi:predicted metal-dependent hydrolase